MWSLTEVDKVPLTGLPVLGETEQFWNSYFEVSIGLANVESCAAQPATLLKLTLLHGCFSRFLNCTNGTKSRNASHVSCQINWEKDNISGIKFYEYGILYFSPLSANPTKWSNTLKQLVGKSQRIVWVCLTILWG